jgi:hypothetical protein
MGSPKPAVLPRKAPSHMYATKIAMTLDQNRSTTGRLRCNLGAGTTANEVLDQRTRLSLQHHMRGSFDSSSQAQGQQA